MNTRKKANGNEILCTACRSPLLQSVPFCTTITRAIEYEYGGIVCSPEGRDDEAFQLSLPK